MKVSRFIGASALLAAVLAAPTSHRTCTHISYAQFDGNVCGVIVFREWSDKTVTVEHVGDGLCGLEDGKSYTYHGMITR
jgi:hypothetical protein